MAPPQIQISHFYDPLLVFVQKRCLVFIRYHGHIQIGCKDVISEHFLPDGGEFFAFRQPCQQRKRTFFCYSVYELCAVFAVAEQAGLEMTPVFHIFCHIVFLQTEHDVKESPVDARLGGIPGL